MTLTAHTPVLIVGAGPTGLAAANLLGMYGVQALLIERNPTLTTFPRAISIDDEGLRICQMLGLREQVLSHVSLDLAAEYRSQGQLLARITPTNRRNGYPLISTFDQPGLEAALLAGLKRFSHITVRFGQTLETCIQTTQEIQARIRTASGQIQHISCSYLLACDGGKSTIRHTLGIELRGTTFPQRWLVVDGLCDEPRTTNHITFFCDPGRPAVSVPAPGRAWRWEFMLHPHEDEHSLLVPGAFPKLLHQIGDLRKPQIVRQSVYTFHASYASTFSVGRIFLLGDAAHLLPPFGGQGMICGLRDACNLAWKLALVLQQRAKASLLATYQQERMPHVRQMIRFSAWLGNVVMPTNRLQASLRDLLLQALMALPPVSSALTEMRVKPASSYRNGLRSSDGSQSGMAYAGQLLPQPLVRLPDHTSMLLDDILGSGFALLRLTADPSTAFTPLRATFWQKLQPRLLCLLPSSAHLPETPRDILTVQDDQQFARFVHGHQDLFILVRPDHYVCGAFHVDREQTFVRTLQHYFL